RCGISRRCTNSEKLHNGSRRHCGAGGLMRTASYPILMSLALGFLGSVNPAYGVSILAPAVSTAESSQLGKEQNRAVCSLILESDGRRIPRWRPTATPRSGGCALVPEIGRTRSGSRAAHFSNAPFHFGTRSR